MPPMPLTLYGTATPLATPERSRRSGTWASSFIVNSWCSEWCDAEDLSSGADCLELNEFTDWFFGRLLELMSIDGGTEMGDLRMGVTVFAVIVLVM
jgi:hypothetical protein